MTTQLPYLICSILSFVPAIVLHEMAHGFAAWKLGDPTAKRAGRLSFNPLAHIDPFGTVIMPFLLMAMNMPVFGYAKPVPYNPAYFKDPRKGDLIVGLAGPAANLLLAVLAGVVAWVLYGFAPVAQWVVQSQAFFYFYLMFLPMFALINLYLMFFNLLPIPPLDGSSIVVPFLKGKALDNYYRLQQYAMPILIIVLYLLPMWTGIDVIGRYFDITVYPLAEQLLSFAIAGI